MTYWLYIGRSGEPENLYRAHSPAGYLEVDVWFQDDWQDSGLTQAELDGLGGANDFRRIAKKDEALLVARFKKTLNYA